MDENILEDRHKIEYDLELGRVTDIKFKQGNVDTSVIEVTLFTNGKIMDITDEVIEFRFAKSDHTEVYQDFSSGVSITDTIGGKVQCILKGTTTAFPGVVRCEIHRVKAGKELITPCFSFTVASSIGGGALSTNYISAVESKIVEWQTQINDAILNGVKGEQGIQGIAGTTVTSSTTNGKIKINGTETSVYNDTVIVADLANIATVNTSTNLINILTNVGGVTNKIINLAQNTTFTLSSLINIVNTQNLIVNGNGSTIDGGLLFHGTYAKNIVIRDVNFITSQNVDLVKFTCEMDNVIFENCTFQQNSPAYGGADNGLIYFNNGAQNINGLTITKCSFISTVNSNFKVGIKLHKAGGTVTANNIIITDNYFQVNGFGIESNCANNMKIQGCTFYQCSVASSSAGISAVTGCNNVSINDCSFIQCSWGIEICGTTMLVDNCYFKGTSNKWNIVTDGNSTDIIIKNCLFYDGVVGIAGTIAITNYDIDNNKFYGVTTFSSIELANSTIIGVIIKNNHFKGVAGIFYYYSYNALLTGVVIRENIVDNNYITSGSYSFRFNPSQNKDEITIINNEVLGTVGFCDIRTTEAESFNKSHYIIGGQIYNNRVIGNITSTQKGFILTVDKNATGGVPQGFIRIYASMYNSNLPALFGEYRLALGSYSSTVNGVSAFSVMNTNFGDLTVTMADDGSGHINISVIFANQSVITDNVRLLFELFGMNGGKFTYRGFTGIAKP